MSIEFPLGVMTRAAVSLPWDDFSFSALSQRYLPHVQARRFAHNNGLPWERLGLLEAAMSSYWTVGVNALPSEQSSHLEQNYELASQAFAVCGSPIEELFLAEILFHGPAFGWALDGDWVGGWPFNGALLALQRKLGQYRADFTIESESTRVVVELDGHEFHERTKAQAQRDKARDRQLQADGWRVLRFTGSEIWKDPRRCVAETLSFVGIVQ